MPAKPPEISFIPRFALGHRHSARDDRAGARDVGQTPSRAGPDSDILIGYRVPLVSHLAVSTRLLLRAFFRALMSFSSRLVWITFPPKGSTAEVKSARVIASPTRINAEVSLASEFANSSNRGSSKAISEETPIR